MSAPPAFVVVRDYLTGLRRLVDWLERAGVERIYLLDNDSEYPPLVEYLEETPHEVVRMGGNYGNLGPWQRGVVARYAAGERFVVSDPDVVPTEDCPLDALSFMGELLDRYLTRIKVGFGLKIDDLPDCYEFKPEVLHRQAPFWHPSRVVEGDPPVYDAPIDTTFALHRPDVGWDVHRSLRTGPPYVARHLHWYIDSADPGEEIEFYRSRAAARFGHWAKAELPGRLDGLRQAVRDGK